VVVVVVRRKSKRRRLGGNRECIPGAGQYRSSGTQGAAAAVAAAAVAAAVRVVGLSYVTMATSNVNVSVTAENFFTDAGGELGAPKSIFFNDRLGVLFVRATSQDLDTLKRPFRR